MFDDLERDVARDGLGGQLGEGGDRKAPTRSPICTQKQGCSQAFYFVFSGFHIDFFCMISVPARLQKGRAQKKLGTM